MAAMRRGDHEAAWAISDHVLAARNPAQRDDPTQPYHRRWVWNGRPTEGRHVLVRCYHGLGDTLQFARFLPALAARAASVTVEVQPELLPLLATLPATLRLIPFRQHDPAEPAECDLEIMELAHALRLPLEAAPPPYLRATPTPAPAGAIGLCWRAGGWDPGRSIPEPLLAPLLAVQRPLVALHPTRPPPGFLNAEGCPAEIEATARLMAGLSLVITVDTMVAHLAGALNLPTILLLQHEADWRWMAHTERSPWYPSMRLHRQPAPNAWPPVLARVATALNEAAVSVSANSSLAPAHHPHEAPPNSSSPEPPRSAAINRAASPAHAPEPP